ncbi:hypothetical protein C8A03DRAFT_18950 [Achaetomium macrosporum]|uniref:Zn(2)-C6 fungal-type domain-containing protein n=1 Tax=Achaetomium macrosporum TaxID=79813 RepID=A0AAN7C2Z6_9PEZI|nr:hypothetical protein C8A03DRAFT_18950 [Achaetomium macrosporum]
MGDWEEATQASHGTLLFIVNNEPPAETAPQSARRGKKRPHHKSRRGCLACKRRRVKCDAQCPCSNCVKRKESCIHTSTDVHTTNRLGASVSQPTTFPIVDDAGVNLLHLELFYHFQRNTVATLTFPDIWQQVLPWSFEEPYLMCTILCLAATHLSTLRPEVPRYPRAALQLLGKSASLFSEKLSSLVNPQNSEAVIAASLLMHYISWSHAEFLDEQGQLDLSRDPLLRLSSGVRGIFSETFPVLRSSSSVFLSASLYSPRPVIIEAILQHGQDPRRFVDHFMAIWDDPKYRSGQPDTVQETARLSFASPLGCPYPNTGHAEIATMLPQHAPDPQRMAFERIAERLSLLFCLIFMSVSGGHSPFDSLMQLQPDIERCFFTFPVLYSSVFRGSALRDDPRALVVLCHFYRAARILLKSATSWWARQRSSIIESMILRDLRSRGLETCVL